MELHGQLREEVHTNNQRQHQLLHLSSMHIIRNQKGSILLMVVIVTAVLAIMFPILQSGLLQSSKNQDKRRDSQEFLSLMSSLRSQLEDPTTCHTLIGGKTIPAAYNTYVYGVTFPWTYAGSSSKINFGKNWQLPGSDVMVSDVSIYRSNNSVGVTAIKTAAGFRNFDQIPLRVYVYPKNISFDYRNLPALPANITKPEAVPGMKRDDLMIRLIANVDPFTRQIYNCFGFESLGAACQATGGAYSHLGPVDLKCQPDKNCFASKLGLVTNPTDCTTKITSSIPYSAKQVGLFSGVKNYICELCRADL